MRLNADVIFYHLSKTFDVTMIGDSSKQLHLSRPIFYMDSQTVFEPDQLYLASSDHLPAHPVIRKNTVLVCLGDSLQLHRFFGKCTILQLRGNPDFFSVYLAIQGIFDLYDSWNDDLFELFKLDADVLKIVTRSAGTFGLPLILIDGNFNVLASSGFGNGGDGRWKDDNERLSQYSLRNYLSVNEIHTDRHEPLFLKSVDTSSLCVNLFDGSDDFIGCLVVLVPTDEPHPGLDALASYLARILEAAIIKNPSLLVTEHRVRKGVLRDLVEGKPLGPSQRKLLDPLSEKGGYVCVTLHSFGSEQALPSSFLCSSFEIAFPNSYAFPVEQMVVGIIEFPDGTSDLREQIEDPISSLVGSLKLRAGISHGFKSLNDTPTYVRQAEAALIDGGIMDPENTHYYFEDYALTELVVNAISGSPIESLIPAGMARVMEHDAKSPISYLETLKVFLAENMNYSRVANLLFIHRSTLIDRIDKIEKNYGLDLHDNDTRLYLQLILKALDVEKALRTIG